MTLLKNLEIVEVEYSNDNKKVTFVCLDAEHGEIREVHFNRQDYQNGKYVDSKEKAEKVDKWCDDFFSTTFEELPQVVGRTIDVYAYDRFNSFFEVADRPEKFDASMKGEIFSTEIKEITVDDIAIRIRYEIDGKMYESKMTFARFIESKKTWIPNPNRKAQQFEKFLEKFGVPVDRADELIGTKIMVEVKAAFGSNLYGDIKKPKRK